MFMVKNPSKKQTNIRKNADVDMKCKLMSVDNSLKNQK